MGSGDAPRLPDGRFAAGQRDRVEPGDPLERREVATQELPAPDRPVRAQAGAVEDERQRRPFFAVLGEAGGGVGVVVLHLDERQILIVCPLRREVFRMKVARDQLRPDAEHVEVELEIVDERAIRRLGVEIAEVRREERAFARGDAEGRLELRAGGDKRPRRTRSGSGEGANPRERRTGKLRRTTESSQRRWIGRSCVRNASAIPARRRQASSSSKAIGSSERFPLVITSGPPKSQ